VIRQPLLGLRERIGRSVRQELLVSRGRERQGPRVFGQAHVPQQLRELEARRGQSILVARLGLVGVGHGGFEMLAGLEGAPRRKERDPERQRGVERRRVLAQAPPIGS
jgi:hypothetical protein